MKTKFNPFTIVALLVFLNTIAFAQSKLTTANLYVHGNCSMCKHRIETVLDHKGIKTATWDIRSKNLNVTYDAGKITEKEILQLVADAGHDTNTVKAKDETYAKLPFCCLYRETDADSTSGHGH